MTVRFVVMAHPDRATRALDLADSLDAQIVYDEDNHIWSTARRCLQAHDGADYIACIQDDAIISDRLPETVDEIVAAHPGRCVNLYLGTQRPHQVQVKRWMLAADDMGATMIDGRGPYWAVALVIPSVHVDSMVGWGDRYTNAGQSFDGRLTAWSQIHGVQWLFTWPSLVDHDTTVDSLHSRTPDRRAHRFIGADKSGLGTDWSLVQHTDAQSLHPPVWFRHSGTGRKQRVGKYSREWERMMKRGPWKPVDG